MCLSVCVSMFLSMSVFIKCVAFFLSLNTGPVTFILEVNIMSSKEIGF